MLFDSVLLFGSCLMLFFVGAVVADGAVLDGGFVNAVAVARLLSCCWWCWRSCCWCIEAARSRSGFGSPKFGLRMLSIEKGKNCLCSCWIGLFTTFKKCWWCAAAVVAAVDDGRKGWKSDGFDNVCGELAAVDEQEIFELGEAGGVDADLKFVIVNCLVMYSYNRAP